LVLCLLFFSYTLHAQVEGSDGFSNMESIGSGNSMFRSFDNRFKGIVGQPLLYEKYLPGRIYMTSGRVVDHPRVNFDAYTNDLLVKRDNAEVVVNKNMVKKFSILFDEDSVHFEKLQVMGRADFYQPLAKGAFSLYQRTAKIIRGPTNTGAYSSGTNHSEFNAIVRYYWRDASGVLYEIKNKKAFVDDFKGKSKFNIEAYLKRNKTNFRDAEHLIKMFAAINSGN
jgi:hypothetical protein